MPRLIAAVLIVTALAAGFPAAQTPMRPNGAIEGRVLDVETNRPVPGAVVTLMGSEHPRATQADADGRFRFSEVLSGAVPIASRRGYLDWEQIRRPWDAGSRVIFKPGEPRVDVILYLMREAVISGRVVDESGDPVVGLELSALSRTHVAGRPVFQRRERYRNGPRTDDRGVYRMSGLPPGEYLVVAELVESTIHESALSRLSQLASEDPLHSAVYSVSETIASQGHHPGSGESLRVGGYVRAIGRGPVAPPSPDGRWRSYPTTYHPDVTLASAARPIVLRPGDERTGVDIQLRPVTTVRVSGAIKGPRGALAHLPLYLVPGPGEDWLDELPVARTLSDDRGTFVFPAVPPGQYRVHVLKTPAPPRDTDAFEVRAIEMSASEIAVDSSAGRALSTPLSDPAAADMVWASMPITVGEGDVTGISIETRAGARISGRIVLAGDAELIKRAMERGVGVVFERADGHDAKITQSPNPFRSAGWTMAEADGTFHTRPLPPGRYLARVESGTWSLTSAVLGSRNVADVPIDLRTEDISGIVLNLTDAPSVVFGNVRAGNARIDRLAVLAFPVDRRGWSDFGITPWRIRTAVVKADGQYELSRLPAGEYYFSVVDDAVGLEHVSRSRLEELARNATRATVGDRERKRLDLQGLRR